MEGDPLAPWTLNIILHCWARTLPLQPLQVKVYPMSLGRQRANATVRQLERTRLLPARDVRQFLTCAHLQALYAEGSLIPRQALEAVRAAATRAVWGTALCPNNTMRSVACSLALLVPLHRAAPEMACLYHAVVTMAEVHKLFPEVVTELWECRARGWQAHLGIAKLFLRQLHFHAWSWTSPTTITTHDHQTIRLPQLLSGGGKHDLRECLRTQWWAHWSPLRSCLQGAGSRVDRLLTLRPVHSMRKSNFEFGNDGTAGAKYLRFLCNCLWSGTRL